MSTQKGPILRSELCPSHSRTKVANLHMSTKWPPIKLVRPQLMSATYLPPFESAEMLLTAELASLHHFSPVLATPEIVITAFHIIWYEVSHQMVCILYSTWPAVKQGLNHNFRVGTVNICSIVTAYGNYKHAVLSTSIGLGTVNGSYCFSSLKCSTWRLNEKLNSNVKAFCRHTASFGTTTWLGCLTRLNIWLLDISLNVLWCSFLWQGLHYK